MHRVLSSKHFVPSLPHDGTGAFGIHLKITGMCSVLLCLHAEQSVSGCEEGGSQFMQNTENFCMLCFVCSQLDAGQGTQHHDLYLVVSPWGISCFTKSKF